MKETMTDNTGTEEGFALRTLRTVAYLGMSAVIIGGIYVLVIGGIAFKKLMLG